MKFQASTFLYIVRAIETTLAALGASSGIILRWRKTSTNVKAMVTEQRAPTQAEWNELNEAVAENAQERNDTLRTKLEALKLKETPVVAPTKD